MQKRRQVLLSLGIGIERGHDRLLPLKRADDIGHVLDDHAVFFPFPDHLYVQGFTCRIVVAPEFVQVLWNLLIYQWREGILGRQIRANQEVQGH